MSVAHTACQSSIFDTAVEDKGQQCTVPKQQQPPSAVTRCRGWYVLVLEQKPPSTATAALRRLACCDGRPLRSCSAPASRELPLEPASAPSLAQLI